MQYPRTRFHNLGAIAVGVLGGLVATSVLLRGALDDYDGTFGGDGYARPNISGRLS